MPRDKTPAPSPSSTKKVAASSKNGLAKPKVAAALKTKVNPAAAAAQGTSSPAAEPKLAPTIGDYLIRRLLDYGMKDIFGIPGDFVLQFYGDLEASPIRVIGCTREDNAGYAADGYARIHGIGGVCVTYCVGGLSVCNSVAGAFAEKSPVVVITGSPGVEERRSNPLLHHRVREFSTQREVFEKITIASTVLDDALTACREIDRCLEACVRFKRPVYIELPRDMIKVRCPYEHVPHTQVVKSDKSALKEALVEAGEMLAKAERPIILAGVEMHRFGLADELIHFAEKFEIPISATLLGKSVISEKHPLFIGIYEGAMCRESVRKYVEQSDCIVMLGTYMTDIDMGIFTAELDTSKTIYVTSETLKISHHHFHDILVSDFVKGLSKLDVKIKQRELPKKPKPVPKFVAVPETAVTSARLFARINELLDEKMVVVADVGDCLFGAADLTIYRDTEFLSPAYYTSMGFAIPAALGVQVARKDLRPIVLVGDGAFQMTCLELSTILRHNFNPIVIVLNNKGYTTERFIQDGPFNDILNWNYHRLPDLLGGGWGFEIHTEGELDQALHAAVNNKETFCLLNVHLDPFDVSPALKRLGERLAQHM